MKKIELRPTPIKKKWKYSKKAQDKFVKQCMEILEQVKPDINIKIRLERNGKYIEKEMSQKMMCALFDLQFMIHDTWKTVKLNKMDKDLSAFFRIIEHLDDAMHGNYCGHMGVDGAVTWHKKTKGEYIFGKPKWKPITNSQSSLATLVAKS